MRIRVVLTVVAVAAVVAAAGIYLGLRAIVPHLPATLLRACEVQANGDTVALDADQMANAATIAAVGLRRNLPDRAIVVALAAALQESKLRNLTGGDRDSIGLFQQRPSQGWGAAEQISDPRYAANKFYSALLNVSGWQQMPITEAAQHVQRSAFPHAYQKWTDEAAVLTDALVGRVTQAVTCTAARHPTARGLAAAKALAVGLQLDWGKVKTITSTDVAGLILSVRDDQVGWQYAHWLVAHSVEQNVERVRFGQHEWSATTGKWSIVDATGAAAGERVVAEVYT